MLACTQFMQERDWFEASEFLEHFLWKNGTEIGSRVESHGEDIRDEAAALSGTHPVETG
jgi:hypothetical protein